MQAAGESPVKPQSTMTRSLASLLVLVVAVSLGASARAAEATAHDFAFTSLEGAPLPMAGFAGKPVLLVNTASMCGFTYQYGALQRLWTAYRTRGLVVLGVPSNDFGGQEPGSSSEIKSFCEVNFDVGFPMTEKVHVEGRQSHPLFVWLRQRLGPTAGPRWNFHKYLIGPDGRALGSWPSSTEPDSPELRSALERVLPPS